MIDRLRAALKCAPFHHVLVTHEFNASVVQRPRLGALGWHRNFLVIGLPLMKALSVPQLEAVLAHEFGHLAGGHGARGNRLYRLRMRWAQLADALEREQRTGMFLFVPFFKRFAPYFAAYSFPLARMNEYQADAVAARLTSAAHMAEALTATEVLSRYLNDTFWPGIHREAVSAEAPSVLPMAQMAQRFSGPEAREKAGPATAEALKILTGVDNTHPSFADRLKALDATARFAPPAEGAAAECLLGPSLAAITARYDEEWRAAIAPSWRERFETARQGLEELKTLRERLATDAAQMNVDDRLRHALLEEDLGEGKDAALALFERIHGEFPDHAHACFHLGRRLLAAGDERGVGLLETVARLDHDAQATVWEILHEYFVRKGEESRIKECRTRLESVYAELHAYNAEANTVRTNDRLEAHGQPAEVIERLREQLRAQGKLRTAYFVRRRLKSRPEADAYLLGFSHTPWWRWESAKRTRAWLDRLSKEVSYPGPTMILCIDGENAQCSKLLKKVAGSRVI